MQLTAAFGLALVISHYIPPSHPTSLSFSLPPFPLYLSLSLSLSLRKHDLVQSATSVAQRQTWASVAASEVTEVGDLSSSTVQSLPLVAAHGMWEAVEERR